MCLKNTGRNQLKFLDIMGITLIPLLILFLEKMLFIALENMCKSNLKIDILAL